VQKKQLKEREKNRSDKHLLPVDKFDHPKSKKLVDPV
jgi:hypothetical protein